MDSKQAKAIQTEALDAIKAIYAKHDLVVTAGRATFDDSTFNLSVKATVTDPDAQSKTWAKYAPAYGLPVEGFGQTVTINRKDYRIVGLDLNRRGYVVRVEEVATGKAMLFKEDAVRRALSARISVPA
jgi:hypothetical protein